MIVPEFPVNSIQRSVHSVKQLKRVSMTDLYSQPRSDVFPVCNRIYFSRKNKSLTGLSENNRLSYRGFNKGARFMIGRLDKVTGRKIPPAPCQSQTAIAMVIR